MLRSPSPRPRPLESPIEANGWDIWEDDDLTEAFAPLIQDSMDPPWYPVGRNGVLQGLLTGCGVARESTDMDACWKVMRNQIKVYPFLTYALVVHCFKKRFASPLDLDVYTRLETALKSWLKWTPLEAILKHREVEDTLKSAVDEGQIIDIHTSIFTLPYGNSTLFQLLVALDRDDMALVINNVMLNSNTKEDIQAVKGDDLQIILNLLQTLIDCSCIKFRYIETLLHKLIRRTGVLPAQLIAGGVEKEGTYPIAGGGFADVWKGTREKDGDKQLVALKVLRIFGDGEEKRGLIQEFCKEAMVWRMLSHENICPFFGVCVDLFPPHHAFVSPWMLNGDLACHIKSNPELDARKMIAEIALGLCYLHSFKPKIVHGDLKPANVLIDAAGKPHITDFGLARVINSYNTTRCTSSSIGMKGSLRWQAPELLAAATGANTNKDKDGDEDGDANTNDKLTTKSDVYAFGCLCLEVFTGDIPWSNLRDYEILTAILIHKQHPPRPSPASLQAKGVGRNLDDDMWDLMRRCWEYEARKRSDMSEIAEMLMPGGEWKGTMGRRTEFLDPLTGRRIPMMNVDADAEHFVLESVAEYSPSPNTADIIGKFIGLKSCVDESEYAESEDEEEKEPAVRILSEEDVEAMHAECKLARYNASFLDEILASAVPEDLRRTDLFHRYSSRCFRSNESIKGQIPELSAFVTHLRKSQPDPEALSKADALDRLRTEMVELNQELSRVLRMFDRKSLYADALAVGDFKDPKELYIAARVQADGPPYHFDPLITYSNSEVQAWARYYAQGGKHPGGLCYFHCVPGVTETQLQSGSVASGSNETWLIDFSDEGPSSAKDSSIASVVHGPLVDSPSNRLDQYQDGLWNLSSSNGDSASTSLGTGSRKVSVNVLNNNRDGARDQVIWHSTNTDSKEDIYAIRIDETKILEDSVIVIMDVPIAFLKKKLKISIGNDASLQDLDLGSYLSILSLEMFDPAYGLFAFSPLGERRLCINHNSDVNPEHLLYFRFIGRMVGLSMFHRCNLDVQFVKSIYKKLLKRPVDLNDLNEIDPEFYVGMCWILEHNINQEINTTVTFSLNEDRFGDLIEVDLKPGGRYIPVTNTNKQQYVDLVVEYFVNRRIGRQFDEFFGGFHESIAPDQLSSIDGKDFERVLSGNYNSPTT